MRTIFVVIATIALYLIYKKIWRSEIHKLNEDRKDCPNETTCVKLKNEFIRILQCYMVAYILVGISRLLLWLIFSYRECSDRWNSSSIGKIGVCSHHGGVVTRSEINNIILVV